MAVKKVAGGWQADVRPLGRKGPRLRPIFPTKVLAEQFERKQKVLGSEGKWIQPDKDERRLLDIADAWFNYHGHSLSNGAKQLKQLQAVCKSLGNPIARDADPKAFLDYRRKRLADGITENHLNHELTYLKSAFNELIRIGDWKLQNPYGRVKKLTFDQRELVFLTLEEVKKLEHELGDSKSKNVLTVARICLSTGCRWGEAEGLRGEQVHHGQIHFNKTKNGRNRSVPIDESLEAEIFDSRPRRGKLFAGCVNAFTRALERAKIELPKGQKTHVLRHTFASWFMMSGGNLLNLNKILGHQTIQMTMIYAHLAPEHLEEAKRRNPLKLIETASKKRRGRNVDAEARKGTKKAPVKKALS